MARKSLIFGLNLLSVSPITPEEMMIVNEETGGNKAVLEEMTAEEVRLMLR